VGHYSFLRRFAGVDGALPTTRQLYKAFTILGSDFAYEEEVDAALERLAEFTRRWGTPSPDNLLTVARRCAPGQPRSEVASEEQDDVEYYGPRTSEEAGICFALAVLGVLGIPETPYVLLPYLTSPYARERWLAAIGLVTMHDERVLPHLERMLVEFVGPNQPQTPQSGSLENFHLMRSWLLNVLPEWGDPQAVPAIRAGLIATVRAEEVEVPEPHGEKQEFMWCGERYTGLEAWQHFHNEQVFWADEEHRYVYALGKMGAFGALEGIPIRPGIYSRQDSWISDGKGGKRHGSGVPDSHADGFRANVWRVLMCFGALEPQFCGHLETTYDFSYAPELAEAVERLLAGKFGMDEVARRQTMWDFDQASWTHWTVFYHGWEAERAKMLNENEAEE
jgi:hypothetical protein